MAGIISRLLTQNALINAIAGNIIWNTATLDYGFIAPPDETRIFSEIPQNHTGVFHPLGTDPDHSFQATILSAFEAFERVTNLTFNPVDDINQADLKIAGLDDYQTPIGSTAGTADLPGDNSINGSIRDFESYLLLNTSIQTALLPAERGGANSFLSTTLHELGHVLGLDHPHDRRKGTIPVTGAGLDDPNDLALDNRRYTVLSYEDGGLDVLYGRGYGHSAGPAALDIAALQAMYGTNPNTNLTDTVYTLTDPQTAEIDLDGNDGAVTIGRAFFSIWDAGGIDVMTYAGKHNVVLNLNEATLNLTDDLETQTWIHQTKLAKHYPFLPAEFQDDIEDPNYHAGGFLSRIFRDASPRGYDLGGFSIAQGATIENAIASRGDDFLIGNTANNRLDAGGGEDFLHGLLGDDTLVGGTGDDELYGGKGHDQLIGDAGQDLLIGGRGDDVIVGGQGNDRLIGGQGWDSLTGGAGIDRFVFQNLHHLGDTILDFEPDQDLILLKGAMFGFEPQQKPLLPSQFTLGVHASGRGHRMIYNDVNGALLFDADGSKDHEPILLAQLSPNLGLTHTNFRILPH